MKISIIIPVHNSAETIERCVQSIQMQKYPDLEIILIENGSSDNSWEVCKKLCNEYDNIVCLISKVGVSAARNLGLDVASGDIIGFCDADDVQISGNPSTLWKVSETFKNNKDINIVCSSYVYNLSEVTPSNKKNEIWSASEFMNHISTDMEVMGAVWNKFFKAELLKEIRFDEQLSYCEDMHWLMLLLSKKQEVKCCRIYDKLYCYIINRNSVTNVKDNLFLPNGQLKYVEAFNKIVGMSNITFFARMSIRWKICEYSLNCYSIANNRQKSVLKSNILRNLYAFVLFSWTDIRKTIKALRQFFIMAS